MPDTSEIPAARFPGRRVVAGGFLILTTSAGFGFYGLAVYLNALSRERGWEVASLSLATTVFFLVAGLAGLYVARLIARHDIRRVIVAGGVIGGASLAMLGRVSQPWHLFVVYSLYAVGFAAAGLVPVTTVVTRWYHRRRAMAISVASTGLSFGGVAVTPAVKWFIDETDLASAAPWLGLLFLLGTVIPGWIMVRPDPESAGFHPDGEPRALDAPVTELPGTPYEVARRSRFFVAVTVGYVLALGSQVGGIQQLVRLAEERTDAATAAFATLALALTSIVARLAGGRVFPRYPLARVVMILAAGQMLALIAIGLSHSVVALFVSIIVFGATVGNILMLQPLLIAERFGVREYPRLFSRSQFIGIFGTAGGPWLLGWLHDNAGGYGSAYVVAGVMSLAGAVCFAVGGPAEDDSDHERGTLVKAPT